MRDKRKAIAIVRSNSREVIKVGPIRKQKNDITLAYWWSNKDRMGSRGAVESHEFGTEEIGGAQRGLNRRRQDAAMQRRRRSSAKTSSRLIWMARR